mmetsp:Transcript_4695/g.6891  ORF Transcript_4695/g.6891 Transcript_4695/m.6891 type:complete len:215 (-) Transcript_4695:1328-1972(-)
MMQMGNMQTSRNKKKWRSIQIPQPQQIPVVQAPAQTQTLRLRLLLLLKRQHSNYPHSQSSYSTMYPAVHSALNQPFVPLGIYSPYWALSSDRSSGPYPKHSLRRNWDRHFDTMPVVAWPGLRRHLVPKWVWFVDSFHGLVVRQIMRFILRYFFSILLVLCNSISNSSQRMNSRHHHRRRCHRHHPCLTMTTIPLQCGMTTMFYCLHLLSSSVYF